MVLKPEPKTVKTVCTVCGLDWGRHGQKPTLETCVKLLKDELQKERFHPNVTQYSQQAQLRRSG